MNVKILVICIVLLLLGVTGGYYFASNYKVTPQVASPVITPPVVTGVTSTLIPTQVVTAVPTTDEKAAIIAAVKASEVARIGADANNSTYTVTQIQGSFAKGSAGSSGGGAQWFAAKVAGVWKLVFIGNGTVQCSDLTNYPDYPKAWIPECWDNATQKSVVR